MKHAYSYIRFSSPEQAKGDSFRRQSDKAAAWAAKNGYEIVEVLADLGVSAYRGKNVKKGRLGAFLALVDAGKIEPGSVLLVESLDRFSRNTVREVLPDFLNVINEGIGVVTLADERLYTKETLDNDDFQLLASLIVMTRAHEESQRKGERVASAWAEKRGRAREDSEKLTDRIPAWLSVVSEGRGKSKKRSFVVDPARGAIVRRIFEETVQGHGRRAIAKRLNREFREGRRESGSFGVRMDNWQPSYIAKLIRGRAVLGEYQPHRRNSEGKREEDGDVIENYYPAVIDEALWTRANAAMTNRRTGDANGRPQAEAANLIGSLARCECGARMAFLNKGKPPKGGRYYVCSSADRDAGCKNVRYWRWATVEKAIFYHLDKAALEHAFGPGPDPIGQAPQQYDELIQDLARKMERALDFLAENTDLKDDVVLGRRVRQWKEKLDTAKAQRDAAARAQVTRPTLERAKANWKAALAFARRLKDARDEELVDLRRKMILQLRSALAEVRFSPHSIHASMELPRKPSKPIRSPFGAALVEEKKVDGIERCYLLSMIYTDHPGYLKRLGVPRESGEGIFVSSFDSVA